LDKKNPQLSQRGLWMLALGAGPLATNVFQIFHLKQALDLNPRYQPLKSPLKLMP
jgi:hypothetical protein